MEFNPEKKTLVIVESPTKAKTIGRYLPKNFTITASKGHIRDLPEDRMGVDPEKNFECEYIITEGKESLIKDLKKKLSSSEQLLLATDEDREGESISWHLLETLQPKVPYQRMVFHEITKNAIKEALKSGRDLDMQLVKAQEDRRIIDRLYGYEVSPVLWKRLSNKKLSGGRVQSVGLRFLADKELERMNFTKAEYFDIKAELENSEKKSFIATLEEAGGKKVATSKDFDQDKGAFSDKVLLLDAEAAEKIVAELKNGKFIVDGVLQKPSRVNPAPPFTTSTLQQAASSRLHLSSKETMRIAQSLFENGFITYMRTDSVNLSSECIAASRAQIVEDYGSSYLNPTERVFKNKSVNAQEAHEAIRPAGDTFRRPAQTGLTGRELQLYTLIYQRTLATQMAPADKSTTTVKVVNGSCRFSASGTTILFPGFLKAYAQDGKDEDQEGVLPSINAGESLGLISLDSKEHTTQPPARYTEASLIRKLEEKGIGRPSTYSTIISTLLDRGYAIEKERALIPTFMGFAVFNFMEKEFADLIEYSYTAEMESELDKIAEGKEDNISYLHSFYYGEDGKLGLQDLVLKAKNSKEEVKTLSFPHLTSSCTLSDGRRVGYQIKVGPYGSYLLTDIMNESGKETLVNIPDTFCPGNITDSDIAALIEGATGVVKVGENEIVLKIGRRGSYWQKGDRTCNVPKGRKRADEYTTDEIEFLFSLPKAIAKDADGNDILLNNGPFGGYLSCNGSNYRLYGSLFEVTGEKALEIVSKVKERGAASQKEYQPFEGKSLELKRGKYGLYLKWGDENVRLPKGSPKAAEEISQEMAEEACRLSSKGDEEKKTSGGSGDIQVLKGRFGYYIKADGENFPIPKPDQARAAELNETELRLIIENAKAKKLPLKDFGLYKDSPLLVMDGRFGAYIKWNGKNIALPSKLKKDLSLLSEEEAKALCDNA